MAAYLAFRRHWGVLIIFTVVFFLTWTHLNWLPVQSLTNRPLSSWTGLVTLTEPSVFSAELVDFWASFSQILVNSAPGCELSPKSFEFKAENNAFRNIDPADPPGRPHLIQMPLEDVSRMQLSHARFVSEMLNLPLPYIRGSEGIVITAAGSFMPVLIVSLRMLRRTGSTLPVEVFLESSASSDAESEVCKTILPSLNARCMPMAEILSSTSTPHNITRYQLKAFAMLFSSFERVVLMDADCFPVSPPELVFDNEPFLSTGLITWPDYWASTTSPLFFLISSTRQIPAVTDRSTSESGQVLLSKAQHATTLMLIAYYNYYGPTHFYPLLSQGASGQGDKETFLAAAVALEAPFYDVNADVITMGWHGTDAFHGIAALQPNPSDDYELRRLGDKSKTARPRELFVHHQSVKTDAARLPAMWLTDIRTRLWGSVETTVERFGKDVEKHMWEELVWTACELENIIPDWQGKTDICRDARRAFSLLTTGVEEA